MFYIMDGILIGKQKPIVKQVGRESKGHFSMINEHLW